jgi:hypothetical protein
MNPCVPIVTRRGENVCATPEVAAASVVARDTALLPTPSDQSKIVAVVATAAPVLQDEIVTPVI